MTWKGKTDGLGNYYTQVALGNILGVFRVYKFGRGIGKGAGIFAPLTDLFGNYIFPDTEDFVTPTSPEGVDVPAGAGAWNVWIYGLNAEKNMISELVPIGQASTKKFWRVFRAFVWQCGTNLFPYTVNDVGNNVGAITITHAGTTLPVAIIQARKGQTMMAIFTVPKGHIALVHAADTNAGKENDQTGMFWMRDTSYPNAPWRIQGERDMYRNSVGKDWTLPGKFTEGMDIVMAVEGAMNDPISGTFELEVRRVK